MAELLEIAADKFTFRVAADRLYSPEGVWVRPESPARVRVGLTDFMQQHSGDVAFLSVKPVGTRFETGDEFAELETVKVNVGVQVPLGGTVAEINAALELTPELVNEDPYGKGWLAVIEPASWERDRAKLLDASAYLELVRSRVEQELKSQ